MAEQIIKIALLFTVFGIIFLFKMKYNRHELKRHDRENTIDEAIIYPTKVMVKWDLRVILLILLILLLIPYLNKTLSIIDALQAIFFVAIMYAWHRHLFFTKGSKFPDKSITRAQINKDEMFIFSLPIVVIVPALLARDINTLDAIQAFAACALMYAWRKYFYHKLS